VAEVTQLPFEGRPPFAALAGVKEADDGRLRGRLGARRSGERQDGSEGEQGAGNSDESARNVL
jgi:hypothetical protein